MAEPPISHTHARRHITLVLSVRHSQHAKALAVLRNEQPYVITLIAKATLITRSKGVMCY